MKMFSFSRLNEQPVGFMTCLKSWFCVDICRYDTFHFETVDTTNWINKFPQTLNRNSGSFVHCFLWSHQNQTEDIVACNEIVSGFFVIMSALSQNISSISILLALALLWGLESNFGGALVILESKWYISI